MLQYDFKGDSFKDSNSIPSLIERLGMGRNNSYMVVVMVVVDGDGRWLWVVVVVGWWWWCWLIGMMINIAGAGFLPHERV